MTVAKLDWAGLAAIIAIGTIGYVLGLPWWLVALAGAGYAIIQIAVEFAWRSKRRSTTRPTKAQDEEKGKRSSCG